MDPKSPPYPRPRLQILSLHIVFGIDIIKPYFNDSSVSEEPGAGMKRKNLFCCAALALIVCLCGCGRGRTPETTAIPAETGGTFFPETAGAPTTAAAQAPEPDDRLYLTVSRITFSLEGEQEEIYAGTVPAELVTWGSEDESVAVFQDGILTASGPGETTVFARYGEQRVSCAVSCLARTQEELERLDQALLSAPKRIPPAVDDDMTGFFADSVFIGDSITYNMSVYERIYGLLGHPLFLARGSASLNGFVRYYKNLHFRGAEAKLEDVLAQSGAKKAFFLLGQNDLGYRTVDEMMESWEILLERIREQSPDLEIYIQSCFPEWVGEGNGSSRNEKTEKYNAQLEQFAREHDCHYVDVARYIVDQRNGIPSVYSQDRYVHLNEEGSVVWMQALLAYARQQG